MSGSGGVSIARSRGGEDRFYNPPPMRKQQQQKMMMQRREQRPPLVSKISAEKRMDHEDCATSLPSSSTSDNSMKKNDDNSTNLDRFLEFTTPVVSAKYLPETRIRECKRRECELENPPYFVLKDLWESFKEWSAYGAGVPVLLNGSDSVMQYYVPYLSGIQLYIDPSRPSTRQRMPVEKSDTESSRETSSDGSDSDYRIVTRVNNIDPGSWNQTEIADLNIQRLTTLSLRNTPSEGSSSDESNTNLGSGISVSGPVDI